MATPEKGTNPFAVGKFTVAWANIYKVKDHPDCLKAVSPEPMLHTGGMQYTSVCLGRQKFRRSKFRRRKIRRRKKFVVVNFVVVNFVVGKFVVVNRRGKFRRRKFRRSNFRRISKSRNFVVLIIRINSVYIN